jgi:phage shock protein E
MKRLLAACAFSAFALASLAVAADPPGPASREAPSTVSVPPGVVDAPTARRLVQAGVRVLDVRTPAEFEAGHVPGAVNIPYDQLERRFAELGPTSTPLLVYCRTGHRSGIAIETLRGHGFARIYDLKAYDLWVQSELPPAKK